MLEGNKTPQRDFLRPVNCRFRARSSVNISTSSAQQQSKGEAELQFDIRAFGDKICEIQVARLGFALRFFSNGTKCAKPQGRQIVCAISSNIHVRTALVSNEDDLNQSSP